jgi:hypothetical protein
MRVNKRTKRLCSRSCSGWSTHHRRIVIAYPTQKSSVLKTVSDGQSSLCPLTRKLLVKSSQKVLKHSHRADVAKVTTNSSQADCPVRLHILKQGLGRSRKIPLPRLRQFSKHNATVLRSSTSMKRTTSMLTSESSIS